jgi:NAD(P)-dependent dehydrogenase (short-subunit alcohol dehydrogenase family)
MKKLLLVGASNYVAQELIAKLSQIDKIVGITIEEDSDRHRDFLNLQQANLEKIVLDIRRDFPNWLNKILDTYGDFDGFIYFPCQNSKNSLLEISRDDFYNAVDINGYLPFAITQHLIPGMQRLGHGRTVLISSVWTHLAMKNTNNADYCMTKLIMNQLAKQITAEYMDDNITATALYFGTSTLHQRMHDQKFPHYEGRRMIDYKESANIISSILDEHNHSFAGANLMLDGGDYHIQGL